MKAGGGGGCDVAKSIEPVVSGIDGLATTGAGAAGGGAVGEAPETQADASTTVSGQLNRKGSPFF